MFKFIIFAILIFSLILLIYAFIILLFSISFNTNNADYLIVLGSGLVDNKETKTMIDRIDRAVSYLNINKQCKVVVSGGITSNNKVSEASVMNRLLKERNIDEKRIIIEDKSTTTIENMKFCKELIDPNKKIVICSNNYHVFRAKLIACRFNYYCKSISCKTPILYLIQHLLIEIVYVIKNMIDIKN